MEADELGTGGNLVLDLSIHCKYAIFSSLNRFRHHLNQSTSELYRSFYMNKTQTNDNSKICFM